LTAELRKEREETTGCVGANGPGQSWQPVPNKVGARSNFFTTPSSPISRTKRSPRCCRKPVNGYTEDGLTPAFSDSHAPVRFRQPFGRFACGDLPRPGIHLRPVNLDSERSGILSMVIAFIRGRDGIIQSTGPWVAKFAAKSAKLFGMFFGFAVTP
jgi:hypothetical protein